MPDGLQSLLEQQEELRRRIQAHLDRANPKGGLTASAGAPISSDEEHEAFLDELARPIGPSGPGGPFQTKVIPPGGMGPRPEQEADGWMAATLDVLGEVPKGIINFVGRDMWANSAEYLGVLTGNQYWHDKAQGFREKPGFMPEDEVPRWGEQFAQEVGGGIGSTAGILGTSLGAGALGAKIGGALGAPAGPVGVLVGALAGGTLGGFLMGGAAYRTSKDRGLSDEDAATVAHWSAAAGAVLERTGTGVVTASFLKGAGARIAQKKGVGKALTTGTKLAAKKAKAADTGGDVGEFVLRLADTASVKLGRNKLGKGSILRAAAGEGITEAMQEAVPEVLTDYYGGTREEGETLWGNVLRSAAVGAVSGGAVAGIGKAGRAALDYRTIAQEKADAKIAEAAGRPPDQGDIDSPLDTGDIREGRKVIAGAEGENEGLNEEHDVANRVGLPEVGSNIKLNVRGEEHRGKFLGVKKEGQTFSAVVQIGKSKYKVPIQGGPVDEQTGEIPYGLEQGTTMEADLTDEEKAEETKRNELERALEKVEEEFGSGVRESVEIDVLTATGWTDDISSIPQGQIGDAIKRVNDDFKTLKEAKAQQEQEEADAEAEEKEAVELDEKQRDKLETKLVNILKERVKLSQLVDNSEEGSHTRTEAQEQLDDLKKQSDAIRAQLEGKQDGSGTDTDTSVSPVAKAKQKRAEKPAAKAKKPRTAQAKAAEQPEKSEDKGGFDGAKGVTLVGMSDQTTHDGKRIAIYQDSDGKSKKHRRMVLEKGQRAPKQSTYEKTEPRSPQPRRQERIARGLESPAEKPAKAPKAAKPKTQRRAAKPAAKKAESKREVPASSPAAPRKDSEKWPFEREGGTSTDGKTQYLLYRDPTGATKALRRIAVKPGTKPPKTVTFGKSEWQSSSRRDAEAEARGQAPAAKSSKPKAAKPAAAPKTNRERIAAKPKTQRRAAKPGPLAKEMDRAAAEGKWERADDVPEGKTWVDKKTGKEVRYVHYRDKTGGTDELRRKPVEVGKKGSKTAKADDTTWSSHGTRKAISEERKAAKSTGRKAAPKGKKAAPKEKAADAPPDLESLLKKADDVLKKHGGRERGFIDGKGRPTRRGLLKAIMSSAGGAAASSVGGAAAAKATPIINLNAPIAALVPKIKAAIEATTKGHAGVLTDRNAKNTDPAMVDWYAAQEDRRWLKQWLHIFDGGELPWRWPAEMGDRTLRIAGTEGVAKANLEAALRRRDAYLAANAEWEFSHIRTTPEGENFAIYRDKTGGVSERRQKKIANGDKAVREFAEGKGHETATLEETEWVHPEMRERESAERESRSKPAAKATNRERIAAAPKGKKGFSRRDLLSNAAPAAGAVVSGAKTVLSDAPRPGSVGELLEGLKGLSKSMMDRLMADDGPRLVEGERMMDAMDSVDELVRWISTGDLPFKDVLYNGKLPPYMVYRLEEQAKWRELARRKSEELDALDKAEREDEEALEKAAREDEEALEKGEINPEEAEKRQAARTLQYAMERLGMRALPARERLFQSGDDTKAVILRPAMDLMAKSKAKSLTVEEQDKITAYFAVAVHRADSQERQEILDKLDRMKEEGAKALAAAEGELEVEAAENHLTLIGAVRESFYNTPAIGDGKPRERSKLKEELDAEAKGRERLFQKEDGTAVEYEPDGDIFESDAEAIVNPVNTAGVMGKGLAKAFKDKYPSNFKVYEAASKSGDVETGRMFVSEEKGKLIVNFPTKKHWRNKSKLEWIAQGLVDLRKVIKDRGIESIAIPKLGAGLGGLDWNDVRPLIEGALGGIEGLSVTIYGEAAPKTNRERIAAKPKGTLEFEGSELLPAPEDFQKTFEELWEKREQLRQIQRNAQDKLNDAISKIGSGAVTAGGKTEQKARQAQAEAQAVLDEVTPVLEDVEARVGAIWEAIHESKPKTRKRRRRENRAAERAKDQPRPEPRVSPAAPTDGQQVNETLQKQGYWKDRMEWLRGQLAAIAPGLEKRQTQLEADDEIKKNPAQYVKAKLTDVQQELTEAKAEHKKLSKERAKVLGEKAKTDPRALAGQKRRQNNALRKENEARVRMDKLSAVAHDLLQALKETGKPLTNKQRKQLADTQEHYEKQREEYQKELDQITSSDPDRTLPEAELVPPESKFRLAKVEWDELVGRPADRTVPDTTMRADVGPNGEKAYVIRTTREGAKRLGLLGPRNRKFLPAQVLKFTEKKIKGGVWEYTTTDRRAARRFESYADSSLAEDMNIVRAEADAAEESNPELDEEITSRVARIVLANDPQMALSKLLDDIYDYRRKVKNLKEDLVTIANEGGASTKSVQRKLEALASNTNKLVLASRVEKLVKRQLDKEADDKRRRNAAEAEHRSYMFADELTTTYTADQIEADMVMSWSVRTSQALGDSETRHKKGAIQHRKAGGMRAGNVTRGRRPGDGGVPYLTGDKEFEDVESHVPVWKVKRMHKSALTREMLKGWLLLEDESGKTFDMYMTNDPDKARALAKLSGNARPLMDRSIEENFRALDHYDMAIAAGRTSKGPAPEDPIMVVEKDVDGELVYSLRGQHVADDAFYFGFTWEFEPSAWETRDAYVALKAAEWADDRAAQYIRVKTKHKGAFQNPDVPPEHKRGKDPDDPLVEMDGKFLRGVSMELQVIDGEEVFVVYSQYPKKGIALAEGLGLRETTKDGGHVIMPHESWKAVRFGAVAEGPAKDAVELIKNELAKKAHENGLYGYGLVSENSRFYKRKPGRRGKENLRELAAERVSAIVADKLKRFNPNIDLKINEDSLAASEFLKGIKRTEKFLEEQSGAVGLGKGQSGSLNLVMAEAVSSLEEAIETIADKMQRPLQETLATLDENISDADTAEEVALLRSVSDLVQQKVNEIRLKVGKKLLDAAGSKRLHYILDELGVPILRLSLSEEQARSLADQEQRDTTLLEGTTEALNKLLESNDMSMEEKLAAIDKIQKGAGQRTEGVEAPEEQEAISQKKMIDLPDDQIEALVDRITPLNIKSTEVMTRNRLEESTYALLEMIRRSAQGKDETRRKRERAGWKITLVLREWAKRELGMLSLDFADRNGNVYQTWETWGGSRPEENQAAIPHDHTRIYNEVMGRASTKRKPVKEADLIKEAQAGRVDPRTGKRKKKRVRFVERRHHARLSVRALGFEERRMIAAGVNAEERAMRLRQVDNMSPRARQKWIKDNWGGESLAFGRVSELPGADEIVDQSTKDAAAWFVRQVPPGEGRIAVMNHLDSLMEHHPDISVDNIVLAGQQFVDDKGIQFSSEASGISDEEAASLTREELQARMAELQSGASRNRAFMEADDGGGADPDGTDESSLPAWVRSDDPNDEQTWVPPVLLVDKGESPLYGSEAGDLAERIKNTLAPGAGVRVEVLNGEDKGMFGSFGVYNSPDGDEINIAASALLKYANASAALHHEVIHYLRATGRFTAHEWLFLKAHAFLLGDRRVFGKKERGIYENMYWTTGSSVEEASDLTDEERIAHDFQAWVLNREAWRARIRDNSRAGVVEKIYGKIQLWMADIAERIYRDIAEGRISKRNAAGLIGYALKLHSQNDPSLPVKIEDPQEAPVMQVALDYVRFLKSHWKKHGSLPDPDSYREWLAKENGGERAVAAFAESNPVGRLVSTKRGQRRQAIQAGVDDGVLTEDMARQMLMDAMQEDAADLAAGRAAAEALDKQKAEAIAKGDIAPDGQLVLEAGDGRKVRYFAAPEGDKPKTNRERIAAARKKKDAAPSSEPSTEPEQQPQRLVVSESGQRELERRSNPEPTPTLVERAIDWLKMAKDHMTRFNPHLERLSGAYTQLEEAFKLMLREIDRGAELTSKGLRDFFEGLTPEQSALAEHAVVMNDFLEDRMRGKAIPGYGGTAKKDYREFDADMAHLQELLEKPENKAVADALQRRRIAYRDLVEEAKALGVFSPGTDVRAEYYQHVVEHYKEKGLFRRGSRDASLLKESRYLQRRGTELPIDLSFADVEAAAVNGLRQKIALARMMRKVQANYDVRSDMIADVLEHNKAALDARILEEFNAAMEKLGRKAALTPDSQQAVRDLLNSMSPAEKSETRSLMPVLSAVDAYNGSFQKHLDNFKSAVQEQHAADSPVLAYMPKSLMQQLTAVVEEDEAHVSVVGLARHVIGHSELDVNDEGAAKMTNAASDMLAILQHREAYLIKAMEGEHIPLGDMDNTLKAIGKLGGKLNEKWGSYHAFQSQEGNLIMTAKVLPDHLFQQLTGDILKKMKGDGNLIPLELLRMVGRQSTHETILGPARYQMVVDENVFNALEHWNQEDQEQRELAKGGTLPKDVKRLYRWTYNRLKEHILISPLGIIPYWGKQFVGDFVAAIESYPGLVAEEVFGRFQYTRKAMRDLRNFMYRGEPPSPELDLALEFELLGSGHALADIKAGEVDKSQEYYGQKKTDNLLKRAYKGYYGWASKATTWRENMERYRLFLYLRDQIAKERGFDTNMEVKSKEELKAVLQKVGYGGALRGYVLGLKDWNHVAAVLASNSLINYADMTAAGEKMRRNLFMFYGFREGTIKRYKRLIANTIHEARNAETAVDGMLIAAKRSMASVAPLVAVAIWNARFFDDDEEELMGLLKPDEIILFRDPQPGGTMVTLRTAPPGMDMLAYVDWDQFFESFEHLSAGSDPSGQAFLRELSDATIVTSVEQFGMSAVPVVKIGLEMAMGQSFYPELFNPRPVRDRARNLAQNLRLAGVYDFVRPSRPDRGIVQLATSFIGGGAPLDYLSYAHIRQLGFEWLKKEKDYEYTPRHFTERSNQWYYYRQGAKFGDETAKNLARKALREMGVSRKEMMRMRQRHSPLGMFTKEDRAEFLKTLSPKDKVLLRFAEEYHRSVAY